MFELIKATGPLPLLAAGHLLRTGRGWSPGAGVCVSSGLTSDGSALLERLDAIPFDAQALRPQGSPRERALDFIISA